MGFTKGVDSRFSKAESSASASAASMVSPGIMLGGLYWCWIWGRGGKGMEGGGFCWDSWSSSGIVPRTSSTPSAIEL